MSTDEAWARPHAAAHPAAPDRVYIIGCPGSGKTTLARQIGRRAGLPSHELDHVAVRHPADRSAMVSELARSARWVVEGAHVGWTDELLDAAQVIIWLDPGWRRVTTRLIRRSVVQWSSDVVRRWRRYLSPPSYFRALRTLFANLSHARSYDRPSTGSRSDSASGEALPDRSSTAALLARYRGKVIHCRTNEEAAAALARVSAR